MYWDIVFLKDSKNRLNEAKNKELIKKFANIIEKQKAYGFKVKLDFAGLENPISTNGGYKTIVKCKVTEDNAKDEIIAEKRWLKVLELLKKKASGREWDIKDENELTLTEDGNFETQEFVQGPFNVPELNEDVIKSQFANVFERNGQIRLIHDTVKTFNASNREIRGHTLLYGLPAGCKTTLYERFKVWYELDGSERVKFLDATTLSKAGLENWLISSADDGLLPDILVLEEIEKQSPDNLLCLLSVMGSGYVAKHNARIQARKQCNCLIWATCNDDSSLKGFRAGALWSRFAHRWYCPRPSKKVMFEILLDKIKIIGGSPVWADKIMEFGWDELKERDPRSLISLLDGGERLMDNSYQLDILTILEAKNNELKGKEVPSELPKTEENVII